MTELSLTPVTPAGLTLTATTPASAALNGPTDIGDIPVWDGAGWDFLNYWFDVRSYGAVGDGVTDDTAAIQAAIDAAEDADGGVVVLTGEVFKITALTVPSRVTLIGAGSGMVGASQSERGTTTLVTTYDGTVIDTGASLAWRIENLTINGDRSKSSQDLLVVGAGTGIVRNVDLINAGRDGISLTDSLNCHFDKVYAASSKRNALRMAGEANAQKFTKCLLRTSDEWGVYMLGGTDTHFDTCTIESNNLLVGGTTGGMRCEATDGISVQMTSCHFENNSGAAGNPLSLVSGSVSDIGTTWSETRTISHTGGALTMVAPFTSTSPFVTSTATDDPAIVGVVQSTTISRDGVSRTIRAGGSFLGRVSTSGKTLAVGDVTLSAGWGVGRAVTSVVGTDTGFRIRITTGTGCGANPFFSFEWQGGAWTVAPVVVASPTTASASFLLAVGGSSTSECSIQVQGTPADASVYEFNVLVQGV